MNDFLNYSFENPWFFTNYSFIFVLGIFLLLYSLFLNRNLLRKVYVILFSLFFYYKSSGWFLLIFIILIICDYNFARRIDIVENKRTKKFLLILSLLASLSFLLYFKYSGFFVQTIDDIFGSRFKPEALVLPIGISFYTFQSISYIVDVYQKKIKSSNSFIDYTFYMTFFPHLVAGPIVRAKDFIPQINNPLIVDKSVLNQSLFRIMTGLTKKLLLADYLAIYVDMVHNNPSGYTGAENLISMYSYACQIYFDFSGYSDIAIGIALLMGYKLKENFDNPYHAANITDFWRRWHISLSSWLRDYIYIPLGGNRKSVFKTYLFLMITMTIGGIWHGASWKFVLWGVAHGIALAMHKLFAGSKKEFPRQTPKFLTFLNVIITFHFVSLLWIFFRATDFSSAFDSINEMVNNINLRDFTGFYHARKELVFMLLLSLLVVFLPKVIKTKLQEGFIKIPLWAVFIIMAIVFQLILQLKSPDIQPFIYYQF
jgi:alginate O-acetyltransferase complex protein AlgI